ncbi:phosphate ABC transporter ATP-binding protein [Methanoculleus sp. Wushi-C6]|uniref:Phosphate ABC transporter ATP-binding protein n=1 Tax=Methanoculleus caldifontis TaxID=2651577 RepID=A0ABU3WXF1_9EURY|nr:phosphate ABC transporter ATP-binding protein [Methanoculleus sp. Wushi-C6]MDV2480484.1 phosphate ABC transporter ATP-binding protein [Methanoculleus sp. Wushi-C6]
MSPGTPCPALRVTDLTKRFGERTVFESVTFSVAEGECLAVTGPSGSGKSVLLKCLNRLVEPSEGRIEVFCTDTAGCDPVEVRRRVCLVLQTTVLFEGTVAENLAYPFAFRANRDLPRPDFGELLASVGLPASILYRDGGTLSGGEAQRVAIARALALRPAILLLDEPTSALDRAAAEVVEETIRRLNREGQTILFVTHDMRQARTLAGRILVLADGRLVEAA